jgi:DNA-binding NtrC family response regulator
MTAFLIAEDDDSIRTSLALILTDWGYTNIREATNATTTLNLLRDPSHQFIVLLDLLMPGTTRTQTLFHLIHSEPELKTCHAFILLAASPWLVDNLRPFPYPVLPKPFNIDHLRTEIQDALLCFPSNPPQENSIPHHHS